MTCEYVRGTDIKITERRLSVEDTLSRRATREVTQGLNLAHRHFFLIPPLFRGRSRLENDRLIGSFQLFQACSISRAEHSVYTRASESLIAMQLELSYWKDKPCLSLSLSPGRSGTNETSKRIPIARELCASRTSTPAFSNGSIIQTFATWAV